MSTERFELIAPCHFGLEAVLKREILDLSLIHIYMTVSITMLQVHRQQIS